MGVYRGDFSAEINRLFPESKLYLFDTFTGFPDEDVKKDVECNYTSETVIKNVSSFSNTSINLVLNKMPFPENCIIKEGYFPDSINGLDDKFKFVSLDCDLYMPMLSGLEYFYPRLISGGYIMIHDYNSKMHFGVKDAVRDFESKNGKIIKYPLPDRCGSLIITK